MTCRPWRAAKRLCSWESDVVGSLQQAERFRYRRRIEHQRLAHRNRGSRAVGPHRPSGIIEGEIMVLAVSLMNGSVSIVTA